MTKPKQPKRKRTPEVWTWGDLRRNIGLILTLAVWLALIAPIPIIAVQTYIEWWRS